MSVDTQQGLNGSQLEILNPVPPRRGTGPDRGARRLASVPGARIGLLYNGKPGGEHLLAGIRDALAERFGAAVSFEERAKRHPSIVAPFLDEVEPRWDAAVVAVGDCGSCSSYAVMDGIELEKRGIPAVVFVTEPFEAMSHLWARQHDVPDLRLSVFEHPLAHLPAVVLREWGASRTDEVIADLTSSPANA